MSKQQSIFKFCQVQSPVNNESNTQAANKNESDTSLISNTATGETSASMRESFSPDYVDVCDGYTRHKLSKSQKVTLLESKWQGENYTFHPKRLSGVTRHFKREWLKEAPFLRYSESQESVYCIYCYLQGLPCMQTGDWSNVKKLLKRHVGTDHAKAVGQATDFLKIYHGEQPDIRERLDVQLNEQAQRNKTIIRSIAEILDILGKQNIAILGHTPEQSNFSALLNHTAKYNAVLADHLKNSKENAKYTSPMIQNELLQLMSGQILSAIVKDCNNSQCFAFIADESTDIGTKEQISVCVRFVHFDNREEKHIVREEFLTFVEADTGTNAEALSNKFLDIIDSLGLVRGKLKAQGYDGAAVMSGHVSGVQKRIRDVIPDAVYFRCRPHILNICIVHSSKVRLARNVMDTMTDVAISFKYSAKRLLAFQDSLQQNEHVREQMGKRSKLKILCDTRWPSRADALTVFVTGYPIIVESLGLLEEQGDNKARGHLACILKFDFIITTIVLDHIFAITHGLSEYLQKADLDLVEASREASVCLGVFEAERNDDLVFDALYEKAEALATSLDVPVSKPRNAGRQVHRDNVQADTVSEYYKRIMYLPFLDHLITEIRDNLVSTLPGFQAQHLIPTKLQLLNNADIDMIHEHYGLRQQLEINIFKQEIVRWRARWSAVQNKPGTLIETLDETNKVFYPGIYKALCTLLTYPVSVCCAERSFSAMKRIKTPLRNTMTNERLASLAILHIHKDTHIDMDQVIQEFSVTKQRRLALL